MTPEQVAEAYAKLCRHHAVVEAQAAKAAELETEVQKLRAEVRRLQGELQKASK